MYDTMGAREGGIRGKQNPRPIPRQNRRCGNARLNAPAAQICVLMPQVDKYTISPGKSISGAFMRSWDIF